MKITKSGTPETERLWKGTCRECKSEAEAKGSEMTHIVSEMGRNLVFSWERCPVCGAGWDSGYGGMLFYPHQDGERA